MTTLNYLLKVPIAIANWAIKIVSFSEIATEIGGDFSRLTQLKIGHSTAIATTI